ncbi:MULTISPECIES: SH3 domain-containing protein [unclassified Pseudomonas]|nr:MULTISPECIES: SH3 domain-containing protein [unclassified Pseudomonas]
MDSISSMGITQVGSLSKALTDSISSMGITRVGALSKAMAASITSLSVNPAGILSTVMAASISTLGLTQAGAFNTAMAASISSLELIQSGTHSEAMAASISSLGLAQAGKVSKALENLNVEALLDELKGRAEFTEETRLDAGPSTQHTNLDQHATPHSSSTTEEPSKKTKSVDLSCIPTWFLLFWLHFLLSSVDFATNWESLRQGIVDINARVPQTESFHDIRNFIRIELSGKPGDIRLVKGSNVNLREDPSMNSEVILQLPENAVVAVLGKEDRTWLLVSYEHEGYVLDGYVSTKFLKKVRRY